MEAQNPNHRIEEQGKKLGAEGLSDSSESVITTSPIDAYGAARSVRFDPDEWWNRLKGGNGGKSGGYIEGGVEHHDDDDDDDVAMPWSMGMSRNAWTMPALAMLTSSLTLARRFGLLSTAATLRR